MSAVPKVYVCPNCGGVGCVVCLAVEQEQVAGTPNEVAPVVGVVEIADATGTAYVQVCQNPDCAITYGLVYKLGSAPLAKPCKYCGLNTVWTEVTEELNEYVAPPPEGG